MTEVEFNKLFQVRFPEQIAARIQALVISSHLRVGDRLPSERVLAQQFGVSRAAVREAVKLLEERALVEVRVGRGIFVTTPGLDGVTSSISVASRMQNGTVGHLDEARRCLERFIAGLVAERATPADIERLEALLSAMDASIDQSQRFIELDMEFHVALAVATRNPLFLILNYPLLDMIQKVRQVGIGVIGSPQRAQKYHRKLLECIKNRDAAGAHAVMDQHMQQFSRDLETAGLDPNFPLNEVEISGQPTARSRLQPLAEAVKSSSWLPSE